MPAELNLQADLAVTLAELQQRVRSQPSDPKHRVFLFQLLAVLGQWDRALTQLRVAGDLDAGALAMVQTYREALRCEALRAEVFAGQRAPLVFGEPEPWMALLLEALKLTAAGKHMDAQGLRERAFEEAPATPGAILSGGPGATASPGAAASAGAAGAGAAAGAEKDAPDAAGRRFEWIADADTRLGPMTEAIVAGKYYWVPFQRILRIEVDPPADLRDLVWMPARFRWQNGGETVGLVPTRYPGSEAAQDDALRLARRTEWAEQAGNAWLGTGQRMLATDVGEHPLMDVRRIDLDPSDPGRARPAAG